MVLHQPQALTDLSISAPVYIPLYTQQMMGTPTLQLFIARTLTKSVFTLFHPPQYYLRSP